MKRARLGVFPGNRLALSVQSDGKKMRGSRLKMAVLHVVRSRPENLDGCFGRTRNLRRFERIIDREAPAKTAADQRDVHLNLLRWQVKQSRHLFLQPIRGLRRGPN